MATLTSSLIVRLLDQVSGPAKKASESLRGVGRAAREASGSSGFQAMGARLREASAAARENLAAARLAMVDAVAMGYALKRALSAPVKAAADFETAMIRVGALSGATGDALAALKRQALDLGRTTQFTASQAADAMGFLAMAGFKADEILGAMPGTLQLAAAAQLDLASAADIVTNVLTGYGKDVSELGPVNDVLVKAFTSANTDLRQLAEAMKHAGPVASAAGVEFEAAAAAISLMGNAGIQGSMAGTSLKGAISRMLSPTKAVREVMAEAGLSFTDAAGRLLPLDEIIRRLEPHADDAGLMMRLFGQRAGPAMAALVGQGSAALRELEDELRNSGGTAKRIADSYLEGFNGQMLKLRSAMEGVQIAIGSALLPGLNALIAAMLPLLETVARIAERFPGLTSAVVGTAAALIALRVAMIALRYGAAFGAAGLADLKLGLWNVANGARGLGLLLAAPFAGLGRHVSGVLGTVMLRFRLMRMEAAAGTLGLKGLLAGLGATGARGLMALVNPLALVKAGLVALKLALIGSGIGVILLAIGAAGLWIANNWAGIGEMFSAFGTAFMAALGPVMPALEPVIGGLSDLWDWINDLLGPIDESGARWAAWGTAIGTAVGGAVAAVIGAVDAIAAALRRAAEAAADVWAGLPDMLAEFGTRAAALLVAALTDLPRRLVALSLPGQIAAVFAGIDLYEAGAQAIRSFFDGLKSVWDQIVAWAQQQIARLKSLFSFSIPAPRWLGGGKAPASTAGTSELPAIDGARATGGPVRKGGRYLVGEKEPEVFEAGADGWITPLSRIRREAGGARPQPEEAVRPFKMPAPPGTARAPSPDASERAQPEEAVRPFEMAAPQGTARAPSPDASERAQPAVSSVRFDYRPSISFSVQLPAGAGLPDVKRALGEFERKLADDVEAALRARFADVGVA